LKIIEIMIFHCQGSLLIIKVLFRLEVSLKEMLIFLMFLKTGDIRLVSSEPYINEANKENDMKKLILDQPDRVTTQGTTESVLVDTPAQQVLTEAPTKVKAVAPDVLLVENPLDGIDIIKG